MLSAFERKFPVSVELPAFGVGRAEGKHLLKKMEKEMIKTITATRMSLISRLPNNNHTASLICSLQ